MADNTYSNAEATINHTYTLSSTSALVGKTELYISRATASNTYIESITISRPDDSETTAIQTISGKAATLKAAKYMKDGKLVILRDGKEFSVTGVEIR